MREQVLDYGCADDFVAMNCAAHENARTTPLAMQHTQGEGRVQAGDLLAYRDFDSRLCPRCKLAIVNKKRFCRSVSRHHRIRHDSSSLGK